MLTVSLHKPEFLSFSHFGFRDLHKFSRIPSSWTIAMSNYSGSSETRKKEELSIQVPATSISSSETQRFAGSDLRFDRLQVPEKELMHDRKFEFGQFVAREAVIDEEYWVRKEDKHVKRTVLKGVVGTLDLSVRCLLHGETFPGERVKAPLFCSIHGTGPNRYGYVANLCVAKSARRQGIATNMLHFAIELVKSNGIEHAYVHVHRNNTPAQKLYEKMGFEIVEAASSQLVEEQTYLLCCKA
ncbi:uncharacterized protein LOC18100338 isoform X3 [Populus trichocarpa]|uniref:uncharacterized protein LOC18100338 isoform X3 n=1 Tax=Populus trichocarpa TaxID=3694 RepID=UPI000D189680|nr:uncharacterized protein LOC18100338 isoform X3 [Populus trichocarpa]|eukprot:XP_024459454.1 uncharacterized protein LOC18100338 isoform X3 [Populus trichocarpa]